MLQIIDPILSIQCCLARLLSIFETIFPTMTNCIHCNNPPTTLNPAYYSKNVSILNVFKAVIKVVEHTCRQVPFKKCFQTVISVSITRVNFTGHLRRENTYNGISKRWQHVFVAVSSTDIDQKKHFPPLRLLDFFVKAN